MTEVALTDPYMVSDELSASRKDAIEFLFGRRLLLAQDMPRELGHECLPSYPALTTRFVDLIDDLVQKRPDSESGPGLHTRYIRRAGKHALELYSRSAGPSTISQEVDGDKVRLDYFRAIHRVRVPPPSLDLNIGLYARTENYIVDAENQAWLEVVLAKGFRYNHKVALRERIPASAGEIRSAMKMVESWANFSQNIKAEPIAPPSSLF